MVAAAEWGGYTPAIFDDLTTRFERPDSKNRWDSPLFTLRPTTDSPVMRDETLVGRCQMDPRLTPDLLHIDPILTPEIPQIDLGLTAPGFSA